MKALHSPEARGGRRHPAASRAIGPISPYTRACAQEADAATTPDDWKHPSSEATQAQRPAPNHYFLL